MQLDRTRDLIRMLVSRIIEEAFPKETAAARLHQVGLFTLIWMLQGENEPVTAAREVHEETGFSAHLGRRLASVSYPVEKQGIKKVRYWAARIVDGEFSPNDEVDELDRKSVV